MKNVHASCLAFTAAVIVWRRWPKRERTSWLRLSSSAKHTQEPDWVGPRGWREREREREREGVSEGELIWLLTYMYGT